MPVQENTHIAQGVCGDVQYARMEYKAKNALLKIIFFFVIFQIKLKKFEENQSEIFMCLSVFVIQNADGMFNVSLPIIWLIISQKIFKQNKEIKKQKTTPVKRKSQYCKMKNKIKI